MVFRFITLWNNLIPILDPARSIVGQDGVIPPLIDLIKFEDSSVLQKAAATLASVIKGNLKNKSILTKNGGTEALIKALKRANDETTLASLLLTLKNLASIESIANDIVELDAVPIIVELTKRDGKLKKEAIFTLENLATHEKFRRKVTDLKQNLVDLSLELLKSEETSILHATSRIIEHLSLEDALLEQMEILIEPLMSLFLKAKGSSARDISKALKGLARDERYRMKINAIPGGGKAIVNESLDGDYVSELDRLSKSIDDTNIKKAAEAARQIAELIQKGGVPVKIEVLRRDVFTHIWRLARSCKLGWDDGWYPVIDPSKVKFKEALGSGTYATVYRGTYKHKGKKEYVALKAMDEEKVNLNDLRCELATLSMLTGVVDNMVDFKGYCYLTQKTSGVLKTVKKFHCLIMELMDYTLEDVLHHEKKKVALTVDQMKRIAYEMAVGMAQIHSYNILHRDLKPANILLTKVKNNNFSVKIGDFGFARRDSNESIRRSVVGTPAYIAPELFGRSVSWDVSKKTDVYSYGVILWEMVTGKEAHKGLEEGSIYKAIMDANEKNVPIFTAPPKCDPLLKGLIESCLIPTPDDRPHFDDVLKIFEKFN